MQDINEAAVRRIEKLIEDLTEKEGQTEAGALEDLQWMKAAGKNASIETIKDGMADFDCTQAAFSIVGDEGAVKNFKFTAKSTSRDKPRQGAAAG